jgi:lipopolysaccharide transport system permease protein
MSADAIERARLEPEIEAFGNSLDESVARNTIGVSDSLPAHLRELVRYRDLLFRFTQREIKVRYKQTVIGALWAVLQPLSLMLVFTVFFSLFVGMPSDGIPYPIFSYTALLPWTLFSTAVSFAIPSLITNSHLVTRVYFPREIIPLASILAALVDFAVAAVVLIGLLAFYQITPTMSLFYVGPLLAIQIVFMTGVGLLLSAATVLYRDLRFALPLVIQLWMFVTPILYPVSVVPESFRAFYFGLNPMAVIIEGYRRSVLQGQPPDPLYLPGAAVISVALLGLAYGYFKRLERQFADIV